MKFLYYFLLLVFPLVSIGQVNNSKSLAEKWKEVDYLISIQNFDQAVPLIKEIKSIANIRKDNSSWVRAILAENLIIGANKNVINPTAARSEHFEKQIESTSGLKKAVLLNFYAKFIISRKEIAHKPINNGIEFFVDSLFQSSLKMKEILAKEPIESWNYLFTDLENLELSPTLYHHIALNYFQFLSYYKKENSVKLEELTRNLDSLNKSLGLANAQANFLFLQKSINKNSYDLEDLKQIVDSQKSDYNAYILWEIARSKVNNFQFSKALSLVNEAEQNYPNSPWIENAIQLKKEIQAVVLDVTLDQNIPSQQYSPLMIRGRNIDSIFIKVYNTSPTLTKPNQPHIQYNDSSNIASIKAKLVYEEHLGTKEFNNPNEQTTIYKINPLDYGSYTLLISNNRQFKDDGLLNEVKSLDFITTDLYLQKNTPSWNSHLTPPSGIALNIKTGKPYANSPLILYKLNLLGEFEFVEKLKTDKEGIFFYSGIEYFSNQDAENFYLYNPSEGQFIKTDFFIKFTNNFRGYSNNGYFNKALLLTDRIIYKPGQRVFFKAIVYNKLLNQGEVVPNLDVQVRFSNAGWRTLNKQNLKTNEYGSVDSSFLIPANCLPGHYFLEVKSKGRELGHYYFQIEEYKRPTFQVKFTPIKQTLHSGDTAIFEGNARSFSGVPLKESKVHVKVILGSWDNIVSSNNILKKDTLYTDKDGNFKFKVHLTDSIFGKIEKAEITYNVEVINQSGEMQFSKGTYKFHKIPWRIEIKSETYQQEFGWTKVILNTTNHNNIPLGLKGKIDIYKINESPVLLPKGMENLYSPIRKHILQKEEYKKFFPELAELFLLEKNWKPKTLIKSYSFDSNESSVINIDSNLYPRGIYQIVATSYIGKDSILERKNIEVFDPVTNKTTDKVFLISKLDKATYSPGDQVTLQFFSDEPNAKTLILYKKKDNINYLPEVLEWNNGEIKYTFNIPVHERISTINFNAVLIVNNKIQNTTVRIKIIVPKKDLQIQVQTFRDKITPGKLEKWSFGIKKDKKTVQAEILATMYDASLDMFKSHGFPSSFYSEIDFYNSRNLTYDDLYEYLPKSYSSINYKELAKISYLTSNLPSVINYSLWNPLDYHTNRLVYEFESVAYHSSASSGLGNERNINSEGPNLEESLAYKKTLQELEKVQARKNLQETAFFFPKLYSDEQGTVRFEFDSPEALTKWKLLLFAHDKDLNAGSATFYSQTQKQLMVRPNLPRYFREGDEILIKAQVQNLSKEIQKGNARIELIDPETNNNISNRFMEGGLTVPFQVDPQNNGTVSWKLRIPADIHSVQVKVIAATDTHSDGEIVELPILSDKVLITDTEKLLLKAKQEKTYQIKIGGKDNVLAKVQVQSNPILEIISALDYLKNYPYECTEQSASKWFGLKVLQYMEKHYPAISNYFKSIDSKKMKGNLESNAALKDIKLEEMPWIRQIENDQEKLKQLAKLFQSDISSELQEIEKKIMDNQLSSGGFSWFKGGRADTYMSIRILEVFGKVLQLDKSLIEPSLMQKSQNLMDFLDKDTIVFNPKSGAAMALNYLHARHYWTAYRTIPKDNLNKLKPRLLNTPLLSASGSAGDAAKAWVVNLLYGTGKEATEIRNRLQQEMITDEDKGIYWRSNDNKYNNVSLQSYMVEAYKLNDPSKLMGITQYLYYKKNANHWYSTWMTVDAIYALLLANNPADFVLVNNISLKVDQQDVKLDEVVLGQVSKEWGKEDLNANKNIAVTNNNDRTVYGGVYHQYFVPAADVKQTTNELAVSKKYLIERNGKWEEAKEVRLGDKIKVEITVIADKNLNYVHLKDSRPSGVEPVYQASGYQWRRGYYFTLKDASTNYFFDYLAKGKHTFSYEIKANNVGTFNSGITTIDCMYDPTVNAKSENLEVKINE
ncbi:alpha-2-macroglobulin family protein [Sphingobacterium kyonggiense]|uniref:Alpha-2-macroglobulin family protein n=1 Tax=Sphingobacterium kyonggiense TaxID=714075 RepID=A0ABP7YH72_9SPHI